MEFNIENATSWLDPKGNFHPVSRTHRTGRWGTHSDWAFAHNKKMEELFDAGWMRVTYIGDTIYISNDLAVLPTYKQKQSILDFAIESNERFKHVVYENGQGKETELTENFSFKLWLENHVIDFPLKYLIISRKSLFETLSDMEHGKYSKSKNPIHIWQREDGKYQLVDGYHRVFATLLLGKATIKAEIIGQGYSDYHATVNLNDKFEYKNENKYKGLEDLADEEILEEIIQMLYQQQSTL